MKTLLVPTPEGKMTEEDVDDMFPEKPEGWQFEIGKRHLSPATVPDAIVVQVRDAFQPSHVKAMIQRLAHLQTGNPGGSFIVFALRHQGKGALQRARARRERFEAILDKIRDGLQKFPNPDRVDISIMRDGQDLAQRLRLIEAKLRVAPRPSSLDRVRSVVQASEDLRVAGGNLSADAIAAAFGVSLNQLAGWLGRQRQTVSKTPDADSLQDELEYFERVARLRAVLPKDGFLKWLRMPNPELDDKKPLDLLAKGERQVIADLVEDMLTGAPA